MWNLKKISLATLILSIAVTFTCGCAVRRTPVASPTVTFQTETYVVMQTSADKFAVLTRSKAAIDEIEKRLGCDKQRICANEWNGEVWIIERLK